MKYFLWGFLFFNSIIYAQQYSILVIGNHEPICIGSDSVMHFQFSDKLPGSLANFDALLIFSGIVSTLKSDDIDTIIQFASSGHGVYCGAENQPFQQEFNQLSNRLFAQEAWGDFTNNNAVLSEKSMISNSENPHIFAGETTVAVPFNSLVKVEAWLDDQPIITSFKIGEGKFIFDGGYSRFYCEQFNANALVFNSILKFLLIK